jgi:hypothetical protein
MSGEGLSSRYSNPFTIPLNLVIVVMMALNFVFIGLRIWAFQQRPDREDDEFVPFKASAESEI